MLFKHVFDWKNKLHSKDLKITKTLLKNTKICTLSEFYEAVGMTPYISKLRKASGMKDKWHIDNIRINEHTYKMLESFLKANYFSKKNKYAKHYRQKYLESSWAMDKLCWGPMIDNSVKDNCIRVLLPGHKEYKSIND